MPVSTDTPAPEDKAAPDRVNGIVWVASYPKSGNTWIRAFLHNLFDILGGADTREHDINAINEFTAWDLSAQRYEPLLGKLVIQATRAEIAAARPKVQAEMADNTQGLALVKTHHALVTDRGYPTINLKVTSGAIYVVRNPLDVAISFAHHMGVDLDTAIARMAEANTETAVTDTQVYEVYGSWSQNVESWTARPHRAIHVLRYEDMLEKPIVTFGALARHLLLTPNAVQLIEAIDRASFRNLQRQEAKNGFREKPDSAETFFRVGKAGQWKDVLNRRQIRRIVEAHAPQMRRFGYLTDDLAHLAKD
ncbi:MAG: sulfotransferase domain-containing protein [Caulobacteraceae bacterium]